MTIKKAEAPVGITSAKREQDSAGEAAWRVTGTVSAPCCFFR